MKNQEVSVDMENGSEYLFRYNTTKTSIGMEALFVDEMEKKQWGWDTVRFPFVVITILR